MKKQDIYWDKIFTSHLSDKEPVYEVCKELLQQ